MGKIRGLIRRIIGSRQQSPLAIRGHEGHTPMDRRNQVDSHRGQDAEKNCLSRLPVLSGLKRFVWRLK